MDNAPGRLLDFIGYAVLAGFEVRKNDDFDCIQLRAGMRARGKQYRCEWSYSIADIARARESLGLLECVKAQTQAYFRRAIETDIPEAKTRG